MPTSIARSTISGRSLTSNMCCGVFYHGILMNAMEKMNAQAVGDLVK